jgi:imidazolonepropionase-like amidohydrolase
MSAPVLHVRGRVLVGPDDVVDELWVVGGRLSFTPPADRSDEQTLEGWVLPGLVDAHCHVGLGPHGAVPREEAEQQALTDRDRGTLLIRDAGQPGDTRWVDEREDLPKIIRAGRHIARTRRYIRNYAHEVEEHELSRHVRLEAHRGDGWVKLVGDWIDRDVGDLAPSWSREAVADAIAAAHEEGVRVTAHCFGEESLRDLAAAGIDCIEHATGLREDSIDTFAAQGIAIVPTLVNIAQFPDLAAPAKDRFPDYHRHMLDLHERRYATVGAAHEAGVPIYVGTDAGGSLPHGLVAQEMLDLTKAGLTNAEVVSAATWGARDWLGRPGLVGRINVANVVGGAFRSASIGYDSYDPYAGRGLFVEGLRLTLDLVFADPPHGMGLHRVEANIQPANHRSAGLVRSAGFVHEGFSRHFLHLPGIDGRRDWRDHDRFAMLSSDWPCVPYRPHGHRRIACVVRGAGSSGYGYGGTSLGAAVAAELGIPLYSSTVVESTAALFELLRSSPVGGVVECRLTGPELRMGLARAGFEPSGVPVLDHAVDVPKREVVQHALAVRAAYA